MCGIAGIHIFNPSNAPKWSKMEDAIDHLLVGIDHRGGDATGLVAIDDEGQVLHQKASCNAMDFYKERKQIPWNTRGVLLHTRMATQGSAAFPENNHPVRRGSVYIVHNGHIWNDWDVFRKAKVERYGQVDSEAIAALISKYGIFATHKAMEELSGAAAIGVVDDSKPGVMALARGSSSPLKFYRNENVAMFASESHVVARGWEALFGTPPNEKHIEDVKEGVALYLDGDVRRESFTPDDYYYNRYSYYGGGGSSKVYKSYGSADTAWKDVCEVQDCLKTATYTLESGERICYGCKVDYDIDPSFLDFGDDYDYDFDEEGIGVTVCGIEQYEGGVIFCRHNCRLEDCEACNPDDKEGSFLPVKYEGEKVVPPFVEARRCELCDNFFPEDDMTMVKDWEDDWLFCPSCLQEMSEVVADCELTKPTRIHGENLDDVSSVNYVLTGEGDFYPV